jgi:hypothetical protein
MLPAREGRLGGEATTMRRFWTAVFLLGLTAGMIAGCGTTHTAIPAGAQQVHLVVTASDLQVTPATVHAGDVYVVMDTQGAVSFVQRQATASGTPGPLTDADLARLAKGDTEGTAIEGFEYAGCADACSQPHDWMGYGGNTSKLVLAPGKYAFTVDDPNAGKTVLVPPKALVVLQVVP